MSIALRDNLRVIAAVLFSTAFFAGCATAPPRNESKEHPRFTLQADRTIAIGLPQGRRIDTSALLDTGHQSLLTVNNLQPELFTIDTAGSTTEAPLAPVPGMFTRAQLGPLAPLRQHPYDIEGLARDEQLRLYACDEGERWILRLDSGTTRLERLNIDWSPVARHFSTTDRNASFEGIAVGEGKLYVANERNSSLIITVDLQTLRVIDWFQPLPRKSSFFGTHYSDLCWFDGELWVLCRQHRVVLAVNPASHEVLAEFDYEAVEDSLGYQKSLPAGIMEGLAVDRDSIWLITDNNGWAHKKASNDIRPTLVKCPRPDRR